MDILRVKKATNLPTFSISLGSRKQPKSSAMVPDDADGSDEGSQPPAGPSTGVRRKEDAENNSSSSSDESDFSQ